MIVDKEVLLVISGFIKKDRLWLLFDDARVLTQHSKPSENDWTDKDAWRHNVVDGWAGGAPLVTFTAWDEQYGDKVQLPSNVPTHEGCYQPVSGRKEYCRYSTFGLDTAINGTDKKSELRIPVSGDDSLLNRTLSSRQMLQVRKHQLKSRMTLIDQTQAIAQA